MQFEGKNDFFDFSKFLKNFQNFQKFDILIIFILQKTFNFTSLIICLIFIAIEFELNFQEFFYRFQAILLHKNKNPP